MAGPSKTLVFFDIDGTLVQMAGAGRQAFSLALGDVFELDDDIAYIEFSGATDLDVLDQIARRHGLRLTPRTIAAFFEAMDRRLEQTLTRAQPVVFPGVPQVLQQLADDDHFILGLVTGNVESCARRKLACFDLHGHFFLGAFGHEHADRNAIARLALDRALDHAGPNTQIRRSFLVGDTPSDIAAARTIGAVAVAVATGWIPADDLRAAGADYVFEDFSDPDALLRILKNAVSDPG